MVDRPYIIFTFVLFSNALTLACFGRGIGVTSELHGFTREQIVRKLRWGKKDLAT